MLIRESKGCIRGPWFGLHTSWGNNAVCGRDNGPLPLLSLPQTLRLRHIVIPYHTKQAAQRDVARHLPGETEANGRNGDVVACIYE